MAETYAATDDFVNNLLKKSDYGVTAEQLKTIPGLFDKVALASLGAPEDVKAVITNAFANPVQFVAQELAKNVKDSFYTNWASPTSAGAINPTLQAQQDYLKSNNVSPDVISNIVAGSTQAGLADLAQQQAKKAAFDKGGGFNDFRDTLLAAGVAAGNYFVPGSSLLTSQLVTEGAQNKLSTNLGQATTLAAGAAGAGAGNLSAGTQAGQAAGLTGQTATVAGNTALTSAATGDINKGLTSAAIGAAGGQVASGVGGATGSAAAGQIAGGTAAGLLSGRDLSTSLTNAAINTGANAAASGLMNAVNPPAADPYAVGGIYGPDNIDVGGGFNPSGINIPQGEGATLGSMGAEAETSNQNPNLVNSIGSSLLGGYLKSLFTGSPSAGSTGTGNMANTTQDNSSLTSLIGSGLLGGGNLMQGSTNTAARQTQANALTAAGQQAAVSSQFRPVGTTTNFGTSNFQVDPATGQLTSAGYQLSPQLQGYQDTLMGGGQQSLTDAANLQALGRGYIAQTPEMAAQQWMQSQQNLLAPSRDMESARLANQLQQTGRTGVSVAQGGALGAANPEMQALQNRRLMEDLQLASQAQTQGRAQTQFGQGLLTGAYDPFSAGLKASTGVEALGQQPFGLSTGLAAQSSAAGARGAALNLNAQTAAANAMLPANQYNPYASVLSGAAGSPLVTGALGKLFGNTSVGSALSKYLSGLGGTDNGFADGGSGIVTLDDGSTVNLNDYFKPQFDTNINTSGFDTGLTEEEKQRYGLT
jgi:hypothetical protein